MMVFSLLTSVAFGGDQLKGWSLRTTHADQYSVSASPDAVDWSRSALLRGAPGAADFATLMQTLKPQAYVGERVRLTVHMRCSGVERWAGAWMRVDGGDGKSLAFDNMQSRPLTGNVDAWTAYEIVLDVPDDATKIALGVPLSGPGSLWADDVQITVVDPSVPTTDITAKSKPSAPRNLDFEER